MVGRTLVALGPIFALVIGVLSQVRLRLQVEKGSLIGAVSVRGGLVNVAVVTISALFSAALVFLGVTQAALDWLGVFSFRVFR